MLAGAAGLYTLVGGLRAVIYTQAAQAVLLIAGAVTILVAVLTRAGGWHAIAHGVDPAMLSLIRPAGDPGVPWPGLLFGIPVLGFYYWCTNQYMVQQTLAARSLDDGRGGALFAGLLKLSVLFLMILPGTCALLLFPHLQRPDMVYPTLMLRLLPQGFLGLVAAGFVAATMASVASTLNSAATIITMDVMKRIAPGSAGGPDRADRARQHGGAAAGGGAVGAAAAAVRHPVAVPAGDAGICRPAHRRVGADRYVLARRQCRGGGGNAGCWAPVAAWRYSSRTCRCTSCISTFSTSRRSCSSSIQLILIVVSVRNPMPASAIAAALVWTPAHYRAETERLRSVALWRNYRVQAMGLLILTAIVVVIFR